MYFLFYQRCKLSLSILVLTRKLLNAPRGRTVTVPVTAQPLRLQSSLIQNLLSFGPSITSSPLILCTQWMEIECS